jgi:hypothetical protein
MPANNSPAPKRKHPTHLQAHASELIAKHGPRTASMIAVSFMNLGNPIPGNTPDEQYEFVAKHVCEDERLAVVADADGFGGDWIGPKPDDKKDTPDAGGQ